MYYFLFFDLEFHSIVYANFKKYPEQINDFSVKKTNLFCLVENHDNQIAKLQKVK